MPELLPHPLYEVLKDFQPTIAAIVALTAAGIAYLGATAKVRADKRQAARTLNEERLGIGLRISLEARLVVRISRHFAEPDTLRRLKALFGPGAGAEITADRVMVDTLVSIVKELNAVETAWQSLHLFPSALVELIGDFRSKLRGVPVVMHADVYSQGVTDAELQEVADYFTRLQTAANELATCMQHFTEQLRESLT